MVKSENGTASKLCDADFFLNQIGKPVNHDFQGRIVFLYTN